MAIFMNFFEDSKVTAFFTENESPFQVGLILKDESQPVHAHGHNAFPRSISELLNSCLSLKATWTTQF